MKTITTSKGSRITIDGIYVTIRPMSFAEPITLRLVPGVTIVEDLIYWDEKLDMPHDSPLHTGRYFHYAYRNERDEPYVFTAELAGILNQAAAEVDAPEVVAQPATPGQDARRFIEEKRRKMVADINRGLKGPDPDAAADCYDIDIRRVNHWYDKQIAAWKVVFPADASVEAASAAAATIQAQIDSLETLAKGALFYDADGWISPQEQQARHDDYMTQAGRLRAQLQQ